MVSAQISRTVDINKGIKCDRLGFLFAAADYEAHTFRVTVKASGEAVDLTGYAAQGFFNRPGGDTVIINGSIAENVVTVSLPISCYVQEGHFELLIRVTDGENSKVSVYWADGTVRHAENAAAIIDPGVPVDASLSSTSTNPVQNKVVYAVRESINSVLNPALYLTASVSRNVSANSQVGITVPIYNVANGDMVINVTGVKLKRGEQYTVVYAPAPGSSGQQTEETGTISFEGILQIKPSLSFDCNQVTVVATFKESGTATCTVKYTPGPGPKNTLVLRDANGEVTLTAAKLRELLALTE